MHNAAFRALNLREWTYELRPTTPENLGEAVEQFRREKCAGANVTIPHEQSIIPFVDELSDSARLIGAVNTLYLRAGKLIGDNTDGIGFLRVLRDARIKPRNARVVMMGAGDAARAVAFTLAQERLKSLALFNRTLLQAARLADALHSSFPDLALALNRASDLTDANLIINATSIGTMPNADTSPLPNNAKIPRNAFVFDLVYNPRETKLLRDAKRAGAWPIEGWKMLVHQGAASFKLWTGREAPLEVMKQAVLQELK